MTTPTALIHMCVWLQPCNIQFEPENVIKPTREENSMHAIRNIRNKQWIIKARGKQTKAPIAPTKMNGQMKELLQCTFIAENDAWPHI